LTVESESAFNDATGSIVTFATLGIVTGYATFSLGGTALDFLRMAGGGLLIGLVFGWPVKDSRLTEVGHFFDGITLLLRMMIFILLGSQVDFGALADFWWQGLLIVVALMFIGRPLTVFLCAGIDRLAKWKFKELLFMCWVRETGVIPAALVAS
jgi:potassium/hydrogen antiporter